jgi:hypothetical protein
MQAVVLHGARTRLGNVASHTHEKGLNGQLERPKPNLLKAPPSGLFIDDVSAKASYVWFLVSKLGCQG